MIFLFFLKTPLGYQTVTAEEHRPLLCPSGACVQETQDLELPPP